MMIRYLVSFDSTFPKAPSSCHSFFTGESLFRRKAKEELDGALFNSRLRSILPYCCSCKLRQVAGLSPHMIPFSFLCHFNQLQQLFPCNPVCTQKHLECINKKKDLDRLNVLE